MSLIAPEEIEKSANGTAIPDVQLFTATFKRHTHFTKDTSRKDVFQKFLYGHQNLQDIADNNFYDTYCRELQKTIDKGETNLFIDVDWWLHGLSSFSEDVVLSNVYFDPKKGLLTKRLDVVLSRLQEKFQNDCILQFAADQGGTMCKITAQ